MNIRKSLLSFLFLLVAFISFAQTTYYVDDVAGNDGNAGTSTGAAWKTVGKVSGFGGFVSGDIIRFKRGQTFVGTLNPQASNLTFDVYGFGDRPKITGASTLNSWTSAGNGVYYVSLATRPKVVTIAGRQYKPGSTPDNGYYNIDASTGSGGAGSITMSELSGTNFSGASVVYRAERWILNKEPITSQSGTTVYFNYQYYGPRTNWGAFITDDLDCVTAYGEWYWDDPTDRLYVYFGSAGTSPVTVSTIANAVTMTAVSNTKLYNLEFSYTNGDIIYTTGSTGTIIDNCLLQFGYDGLQAGGGTNANLTIKNSTFRFINNNAIHIEDASTNSGFLLEYCDFHQIGVFPGEGGNNDGQYNCFNGGGSFLTNGPTTDAIIRYNSIDTVGYTGFTVGGQNILIQNNRISQFCYLKDDGGAIYGAGPGTNKRWTGNIIMDGAVKAWEGTEDQNIFAYALYADNASLNYTWDNNTIIRVPTAMLTHNAQNIVIRDNVIYDSRVKGIFILRSGLEPGYNPRNFNVKNNVVVSTGVFDANGNRLLNVENYSGNGDNISVWGQIDSNFYARPRDDDQKIYAGYTSGSNYSLAGWRSFSGYDLHSNNAPKTFSSSIVGTDSIKIWYNPTNAQLTYNIPGRWIDHKGIAYDNQVTLAPYRSIVLFADGATGGGGGGGGGGTPPPATDSGYVTWQTPIDSDYELYPGFEQFAGIRKKMTSSQGWTQGTVVSQQVIRDGESFEFAASFNSSKYTYVGIHPTQPAQGPGSTDVLFGLYSGNSTPPQTENGIVPFEANAFISSAYQPATVDSPWYRIRFLNGQIIYGKSTNLGVSYTDFYTSAKIPSATEYRLVFTAWDPGDYIYRARVNKIVTETPNVLPVVNIGNDISITLPTNVVQLNASGNDPDGQIVGWQWLKVSGPSTITFSDPGAPTTSASGFVQGTYLLSLTAWDNFGATDTDTVQVTVGAGTAQPTPPTVNAGADRTVQLPTNQVTLTATATDADGTVASYLWQKVSGSGSTIQSPNGASTVVVGLTAGVYQFRVTATDNSGLFSSDTVNVTVLAAPNVPPSVNAGADQTITLPTSSVNLSGTATDSDGSVVSYAWTKTSGPAVGTIVSPTLAATAVTGLVTAGTYTYRLTATDNSGATSSDFINVVVAPQPVGTAYVAYVSKTWGTEVPTPRLRVRINYTDGSQQTVSQRNGAYVKGVRARYKVLEGGNRLVVIINYSDNTVQEIYKK